MWVIKPFEIISIRSAIHYNVVALIVARRADSCRVKPIRLYLQVEVVRRSELGGTGYCGSKIFQVN
jgi:hypothetical protein